MEKDEIPIPILDVRGKKSVKCPHCGVEAKIQPREISMEKLRHMAKVQKFGQWTEGIRDKDSFGLSNVRLAVCSSCGKPFIAVDEFSTIHKAK